MRSLSLLVVTVALVLHPPVRVRKVATFAHGNFSAMKGHILKPLPRLYSVLVLSSLCVYELKHFRLLIFMLESII